MHWGQVSVRPSVRPVPDPKLRMKTHRKLKIGGNEPYDMGDPWPHLERSRSRGRLTLWLKISRIFRTGRPIKFKLVYRWSAMTCITNMHKGQTSRSTGHWTLWPKITHIFGTGRPTNFKLGIQAEYDDLHRLHHQCAQWPPSWKLWSLCKSLLAEGRA